MRLPVRPETAAAQGPARINVRFPTIADIQICAQLEVFAVLQGRSGSVELTHSWKWKNALQRVIARLGRSRTRSRQLDIGVLGEMVEHAIVVSSV